MALDWNVEKKKEGKIKLLSFLRETADASKWKRWETEPVI